MYLLSIFCPTHYWESKHISCIMNLISVAELFSEVEVVITDNSGNLEKMEFLKKFERSNIKILDSSVNTVFLPNHSHHATSKYAGISSSQNFLTAIQNTSGKYAFFCADDDFVFSGGVSAILERMKSDITKKIVPLGYSGIFGHKRKYFNDYFKLDNFDGNATDKVRRQIALMVKANPLLNAIYKRDIMLEAWEFVYLQIPAFHSWYDVLEVLYLILNGQLTYINQVYFMYDCSNWFDIDLVTHYVKTLKGSGSRPVSFVLLLMLELAVLGVMLIRSERFNLSQEERNQACSAWFVDMLSEWKKQLRWGFERIDEVKQDPFFSEIQNLVTKHEHAETFSPNEILLEIAAILDKFDGSGTNYFNFWKTV
jgi:hypothetical protein